MLLLYCRCSTGVVPIRLIYRRINPDVSVRELNGIMLDAYLSGANYFRLVLTNGTSRLTGVQTVRLLDRLPDRQHGVIAEIDPSMSTPAAILFGSRHFDIFGWFLPLDSPNLGSACRTVSDVYASRGLSRVTRGGSDVRDVVRWNTSVDQHLITLDRYVPCNTLLVYSFQ